MDSRSLAAFTTFSDLWHDFGELMRAVFMPCPVWFGAYSSLTHFESPKLFPNFLIRTRLFCRKVHLLKKSIHNIETKYYFRSLFVFFWTSQIAFRTVKSRVVEPDATVNCPTE